MWIVTRMMNWIFRYVIILLILFYLYIGGSIKIVWLL